MKLFSSLKIAFVLVKTFYTMSYAFPKKLVKQPYIYPKTPNQIEYNNLLTDEKNSVVVAVGPAGCGKTLLACNEAIRQLENGIVEKIVITRPVISVDDEQIGFLPGSMNEKMDPWTRPIFDIFHAIYSKQQVKLWMKNDVLEIAPLAYMRGRTFKNTFIIADEMQNSSPSQMLMLLTRIGEETKLTITGDINQSDRSTENGLSDLIHRIEGAEWLEDVEKSKIRFIELDSEDIQRSEVLKQVIELYEN
jgi:phosphate starvation-inducible PhoH-like protein